MAFRLLLAPILILGMTRCMAQIEQLSTDDEIVQFVRKVAPGYDSISSRLGFRQIARASFDSLVRAYHIQSFEKADLDGNGRTDLIFNGSKYYQSTTGPVAEPLSLAILSFGKDSFYVRELKLDHFEDIMARPVQLGGKQYLQAIRVNQRYFAGAYHAIYHIDTLVWAFNAFIEKRPVVKRKITKIDYSSFNGLAFWGNMTLRIARDSVRMKKDLYEYYNGEKTGGVMLTRLDSSTCQRLYGLLNAIDFVSLKDSFEISSYDASTGALRISYDDDRTKTITDYGTCGTYGLAEIHQLLYGLTETQHWADADPKRPRCIDSLRSDAEVLGLVRTLYTDYPSLEFDPEDSVDALPDYRERLAAFGNQRWQKADIDGNGYTDLLFNGYMNKDLKSSQYSVAVLSFGGDSLVQDNIAGANGFFAAKIIRNNGHDNIQISYLQAIEDSTQKKGYHLAAREDTLTAEYGLIVELPTPVLHHIEKLNVHLQIGHDSMVVTHDTLYWYKNDANPPDTGNIWKDSINLYILTDSAASQKLLAIAAGIRFERLNPELMMPNKFMRNFGSTWYFEYDGGKRGQFESDGRIGSYRLAALERRVWEVEHARTDWKLLARPAILNRPPLTQ